MMQRHRCVATNNDHNSHRSDLAPQRDYVPCGGGTRATSRRESKSKRGSRSLLQYDGGENCRGVTPPIGWLKDYWMGRYYGFIAAPKTQDEKLTSVQPRAAKPRGAAPYAGPPHPVGQREK